MCCLIITTSSTATATAIATSSAAITTAAATSTAALGLGLVDLDGPSVDLGTVHGQGLLGIGGGHGHEGKSADGTGLAVGREEAVADLAVLRKGGTDRLLGALVGQIADVELNVSEAGGVESTTTGGVVDLGLGLIDLEGASVELLAVPGGNGLLDGVALAEGDKGESAGVAGIPVDGKENVGDGSELPESRSEGIFGGIEGKVTDVHFDAFFGGGGGSSFVRHDEFEFDKKSKICVIQYVIIELWPHRMDLDLGGAGSGAALKISSVCMSTVGLLDLLCTYGGEAILRAVVENTYT